MGIKACKAAVVADYYEVSVGGVEVRPAYFPCTAGKYAAFFRCSKVYAGMKFPFSGNGAYPVAVAAG